MDRSLVGLVRERAAALARYNEWEKTQAPLDDRDFAARLAWLGEAYDLAKRLGALCPLPDSEEELFRKYEGVRLMQERLGLLTVNKAHE